MPLRVLLGLTSALVLSAVAAWASPPGAVSYQKRAIAAVKATAPPSIDGDLGDEAWKSSPRAETFVDPSRGVVVVDQTTAWLCYDDQFIYVAFQCKDAQPGQVIGRETVRDSKYNSGNGPAEDSVEVAFDPFRSCRWDDFAAFSVNPLGTPSARITGGRASKAEWKGDWAAAARRTPDGWTAEMRIPWRILNYPSSSKPIAMGINFTRWQERVKLESVWSDVGPQHFFELQGTWTDVQVPAAAFRPTLSLLPHTLSGFTTSRGGLQTGLDARYTLTPEMTLVGAVNPDFATIEGAVEGIAFTRAEQWVPEKRPFFLEGRDYLSGGDDYALGSYFYPNRIGSFDVGTKLYGKLTPNDTLGFLHTLDAGKASNVVAKYDHAFTPTSFASVFFTNRTQPGDNNTVGVATGRQRWNKFGVETNWAFSGGQDAGGSARNVELYYSDKNHFTSFQVLDVGSHFRNANGYVPFVDYRGFQCFHEWHADWRKGPWRGFGMGVYPRWDWHTDGRPFRRSFGFDMGLGNRADWDIGGGMEYSRFDDQTDFTYGCNLTLNSSNRFRKFGVGARTGQIANRPWSFVGPYCSVRVFRRLDLSYGGSLQHYDGVQQQHIVTANYELSPTRSFGGRLVLQDSKLNWYVSYRSAGALGTEMFVMLGDPNAERFVRRLMVKFVTAL